MAALSIKPSFPTYFGTDGLPLENGYIYIGTAGLAAITNPISIYWDSALSVPATQPVRTIGGYPSNSGAPGMLYMNGTDYSILVADKNNVDVYSALNVTEASSGATANTAAIAVNTADIATNTADIATNVTNIGLNTSKLAGIEAGADVTDATNVDAAGAVMNSDTSTAAMSFVIDEDNMASDSATKVPTQQSVKAYIASQLAATAADFGVYLAYDVTTTTTTTWQSTNIGTRIDVTDGAYSTSSFRLPFSLDILSIEQKRITIDGVLSKVSGSEPTVTYKTKTVHQSGANGGETRNVVTGSLATSTSTVAAGSVQATTASPTGDGVVTAFNIERIDVTNELCFRFNLTLSNTATRLYANWIASGTKTYTGTPISSSQGVLI